MNRIRMALLGCAASLLVPGFGGIAAGQPAPTLQAAAAPLLGLWKAERRFAARRPRHVVLTRSSGGLAADVDGIAVPVTRDGPIYRFALPDDGGRFEGRADSRGAIRGHWLRPRTPLDWSYASPLSLVRRGKGRWEGTATPPDDSFTVFLLLRREIDGTIGAVFANPERDQGTQLGVRHLVRTGDNLALTGGRPGEPEQPLVSGAYDPAQDIIRLVIPNRGGSFDFRREGDDSGFYARARGAAPYVYRRPVELADGWRTATLGDADIDRVWIEQLVRRIVAEPVDVPNSTQLHALLIARHGRLVLEEYFHGFDRTGLHTTRSAGKSVTAVAIGAALRAGAPLRLSSPVYATMNGGAAPAGLDPVKAKMTLEDLLTMSSGLYCDDTDDAAPGNEETLTNQEERPDWVDVFLGVPVATPPGTNAVYCSLSPHTALAMLGRATGESPVDSFDRLVAQPLQIRDYAWPLDPLGRPYGGGSVRLTARDFLKFGQLLLDHGRWHGQPILTDDFVRAATAAQYNLRNVGYGYLWWAEDYPYRGRQLRSFSARGAGGQFVTVVPDLDLVVATMAGNFFSRSQASTTSGNIVPRLIMPAVGDNKASPNAPAIAEQPFVSVYGRSTDGSRITPKEQ